jgi:hypothetical protein
MADAAPPTCHSTVGGTIAVPARAHRSSAEPPPLSPPSIVASSSRQELSSAIWTGTRQGGLVSLSSAQNGAGFTGSATREGVPRLRQVVADGQCVHPSAEATPCFAAPPFGDGGGRDGRHRPLFPASSGWAAARRSRDLPRLDRGGLTPGVGCPGVAPRLVRPYGDCGRSGGSQVGEGSDVSRDLRGRRRCGALPGRRAGRAAQMSRGTRSSIQHLGSSPELPACSTGTSVLIGRRLGLCLAARDRLPFRRRRHAGGLDRGNQPDPAGEGRALPGRGRYFPANGLLWGAQLHADLQLAWWVHEPTLTGPGPV